MSNWRRKHEHEPPWLDDFAEDLRLYIARQLRQEANRIIAALQPHNNNPATQLRILIGGVPVADGITLNVDVQNKVMSAQFADDKNEPTTDVPAGAVIVYSSSDPTVITVDASSGALTFEKAGEVDLSAAAQDGSGNPLNGPDGSTPITGSEHVSVTPGPASELLVAVGDAQPVPAPASTHRGHRSE